ncbi:MAG: M56 family metallopeptidase [Proteocatella sp.]
MKLILSLSISGAILYFIIMISKFLFKEKMSKQWQYYLWLIVIVRLILPLSVDLSEYTNSFERNRLDMSIYSEVNRNEYEELGSDNINRIDYHATLDYGFNIILKNAGVIWILIASILLIRKITIYQSFVKYIRISKEEVSIKRWEHLGKIVEAEGISRPVSIYINKFISSPMLIGFFKPCIMLPDEKLSDSSFEYTVLHELSHYKRGDMFYKWLVQIVICIHWFNPIVYLMGKEINKACELACDEAVIIKFNEKEKHDYGKTLIEASTGGGHYGSSLASVTFTESYELIKERLDSIMKSNKKNKYSVFISLMITVMLVFGFTFSGVYAAENIGFNKNKSFDIEAIGKINGKTTYYIYTEKGLRDINLEKNTDDKIYMLANDIVLSSEEWMPIGSKDNPFKGSFNGNGFYIKGLTIENKDTSIVGLFGYAKDAKLHNITLRDYDIASAGKNTKTKSVSPILVFGTDSKCYDNNTYSKN